MKAHSEILDMDFIINLDRSVVFDDDVKYSLEEIKMIKDSDLSDEEIISIHNVKKKFGGNVSDISGIVKSEEVKSGDNPLDALGQKMRAAADLALDYYRNNYVMPMAIHKAARESVVDKKELSQIVGKYAAWCRVQKK